MSVYVGSTAISAAYVGSTALTKIYVGSNEAWSASVSQPNAGFDAVGSGFGDWSTNTATWLHTCGPNATVLIVDVVTGWGDAAVGIDVYEVRTATYNGVAMTSVAVVPITATGSSTAAVCYGFIERFVLFTPPVGSAYTVAVERTDASRLNANLLGNSVSYNGVGALGTPVIGNSFTAGNNTVSLSVSSAAGQMVSAVFACGGALSAPTDTQRYLNNFTVATHGGNMLIEDQPGQTTAVLGATNAANVVWGGIAVALNPVPQTGISAAVKKVRTSLSGAEYPKGTAAATLDKTIFAGVGTQFVGYDAVGGGNALFNTNTATWSHTCGANAKVLIVDVVSGWGDANTAISAYEIRTATYNSVAMTSVAVVPISVDGTGTAVASFGFIERFALFNPPKGSAYTVAVNMTDSPRTNATLLGCSVSYTNVGSLATSVTGNSFTAGGSTISLTAASAIGEMVSSVFGCGGALSAPTDTQRYLNNLTTATVGGNILIEDQAGAASAVLGATNAAAAPWGGIATALKPLVGTAVPTGTIAATRRKTIFAATGSVSGGPGGLDPSTLWGLSPPAGTSSAPSGSTFSGNSGEFDYAILAENQLWDNFDGAANTTINSQLWQTEGFSEEPGVAVYDPGTAHVFKDGAGHVVLRATKSGSTINSGKFSTRTKFNVRYGWVAARIKFAQSAGSVGRSWFPAFWLLHVPWNGGTYGEIDMMEFFGNTLAYSTHVYRGSTSSAFTSDIDVPASHGNDASLGYHTYWMLWESTRIRIGVDDLYMGDWTQAQVPAGSSWAGLQLPHRIILNFQIHPSYLPAPLDSDFPADMLIDWVWYKPLTLL